MLAALHLKSWQPWVCFKLSIVISDRLTKLYKIMGVSIDEFLISQYWIVNYLGGKNKQRIVYFSKWIHIQFVGSNERHFITSYTIDKRTWSSRFKYPILLITCIYFFSCWLGFQHQRFVSFGHPGGWCQIDVAELNLSINKSLHLILCCWREKFWHVQMSGVLKQAICFSTHDSVLRGNVPVII